jgi:hypothetical protein
MGRLVTDGGADGTNGGSSGGISGAGKSLRLPLWVWLAYGACLILFAAVSATSFWMEASRAGRPADLLDLGVKEATSIVVVFALTFPLLAWVGRLQGPGLAWPRVVLGHLAGLVVFSLAHTAGMTALRLAIYTAVGARFTFGPFWQQLLYEFRKDVLVYLGLVGGALMLQRALRRPARPEPAAPGEAADPRIEIRDGARRIWLAPAEILWVEAAGNYVEVHTPGRSVLWRRTLAAVEQDLADKGFVRVHRSRLVNLRHVRATANKDSGDFTLTLADGAEIAGARRWRAAFERAAAR